MSKTRCGVYVMQKLFFLLTVLVVSGAANGKSTGQFIGQQFMINIVSQSSDGSTDVGPKLLFEKMNVPPQSGFTGIGKVLETKPKELSFICSEKQPGNFQCSILIFFSKYSEVSFNGAQIKYTGATAAALYHQFNHKINYENQKGGFEFTDQDGLFKLVVKEDLFEIIFKK